MPLCKTKDKEGHTGVGVTCEIPDESLRRMSAGEVFERLSAEFWGEFIRMSGTEPSEDLDLTYNRSFLEQASKIIH